MVAHHVAGLGSLQIVQHEGRIVGMLLPLSRPIAVERLGESHREAAAEAPPLGPAAATAESHLA